VLNAVGTGFWNLPLLYCGERCIRASRSPVALAPKAAKKAIGMGNRESGIDERVAKILDELPVAR